MLKESSSSKEISFIAHQHPAPSVPRRHPRSLPVRTYNTVPAFDEPDAAITAPRLFASQNRTWQALTGHGIDIKKVPSMEFVLLSLIASRGAEGIAQPDLIRLSGQDKRSVPHRTDELSRKGYIVKSPIQGVKTRTSFSVHSRFVTQCSQLTSSAVENVYQKGAFLLAGFVNLLYDKLKDEGVVPTRNIRTKLVRSPSFLQRTSLRLCRVCPWLPGINVQLKAL